MGECKRDLLSCWLWLGFIVRFQILSAWIASFERSMSLRGRLSGGAALNAIMTVSVAVGMSLPSALVVALWKIRKLPPGIVLLDLALASPPAEPARRGPGLRAPRPGPGRSPSPSRTPEPARGPKRAGLRALERAQARGRACRLATDASRGDRSGLFGPLAHGMDAGARARDGRRRCDRRDRQARRRDTARRHWTTRRWA